MDLQSIKAQIQDEVSTIISSSFTIEISETGTVPGLDESEITYPNFSTGRQKCKLIETCVLYIDIRQSTQLNLTHRRETMAKLYSAFVRSMARSSEVFGGKVRNVIGDRLMVLFDRGNCFFNAIQTAVLLNSVAKHVLNKEFPHDEIACGIGIDYGKMLVAKTGLVKHGVENAPYKSLVWLGRPANVASKLTDAASKVLTTAPYVAEARYFSLFNKVLWFNRTLEQFVDDLQQPVLSTMIQHKSPDFRAFYKWPKARAVIPPILFTETVLNGLRKTAPYQEALRKGWWAEQPVNVAGYQGKIYGGDVVFTAFVT